VFFEAGTTVYYYDLPLEDGRAQRILPRSKPFGMTRFVLYILKLLIGQRYKAGNTYHVEVALHAGFVRTSSLCVSAKSQNTSDNKGGLVCRLCRARHCHRTAPLQYDPFDAGAHCSRPRPVFQMGALQMTLGLGSSHVVRERCGDTKTCLG
jgi:hypothetical protein